MCRHHEQRCDIMLCCIYLLPKYEPGCGLALTPPLSRHTLYNNHPKIAVQRDIKIIYKKKYQTYAYNCIAFLVHHMFPLHCNPEPWTIHKYLWMNVFDIGTIIFYVKVVPCYRHSSFSVGGSDQQCSVLHSNPRKWYNPVSILFSACAHIHRHWYWLIKVRNTSCISCKQFGMWNM